MRAIRPWLVGALAFLALGGASGLALAARAPIDPYVPVVLIAHGAALLGVTLALGILPAYMRRDWPAPLFALAAIGVGALGPILYAATRDLRALCAPLGVSLILAAAQPIVLRYHGAPWKAGEPLLARANAFRTTDLAALGAIAIALVGTAAGGALLLILPRGLPNAALVALTLATALPAAFGALLFMLPREARAPQRGATLAWATLGILALAALSLAVAFARPIGADFRWPATGVALAISLGIVALLRIPRAGAPLLRASFALAILAGIALVLATATGIPSELAPLALLALLVFGLTIASAATLASARILFPGRARGARWWTWTTAIAIAGLFLLAPSFQYPRSAFPGALVLTLALALAIAGLAPLASNAPTRSRTR